MIPSSREAIACILVIFGSALCYQSQTVPIKSPTATISGKVTVKGKGVPGIVVGLRLVESANQPNTRYKAVTDEQGTYRIIDVPPGNYQILTAAPTFVSADDQGSPDGKTLIVAKDETIENIDFALVRGGVITGKVTDSDGRPLIEEPVSLYPAEMSNNRFQYVRADAHTDDRGIYRIFGLRPGKYRVAAGQREDGAFGGRERTSYRQTFHPAAADISQAGIIEVTEGSEATNVDITLSRTLVKYSARGRIIDGETGRAVANVPYGLTMFVSETSSSSMSNGSVSNSEGEFRLDNLSPGKYGVFIEPRANTEWRAEMVRFEVIDQDVTGLVVKTVKGGSVSGMIVLEGTEDKEARAGLKRVRLYAYVMNQDAINNPSQSITNPDGSFRVSGLQGGTVGFSFTDRDRFQIVRVERDGIVYPKGIELKEGEQVSGVRVIVNYANGTIRGVVKVENGTLSPNAVIYISLRRLSDDVGPYFENAQVDSRGQFLKEGLISGMYEVTGAVYMRESRGPVPNTKQQVIVTSGAVTNVTLTLNLNSTSGRP